jgi:hypothetical protein
MRPSDPRVVVAARAAKPAEPVKTEPRADLVVEPVVLAPPRATEAQPVAESAPPPQAVAPEPEPVVPVMAPEPPTQPEPAILPEPLIEPVKPPDPPVLPRRVAEPEPAATPIQTAAPVSFPPVQPIGVAPAGGPDAAPTPDSKQATAKTTRPDRRVASAHAGPRKRAIRPAVYPISEFLAWRR